MYTLEKKGLNVQVTSVMADFEVGIQTAIQTCLPGVEIRGCRFLFGQAVWRKAMRDFGKIHAKKRTGNKSDNSF